jgi:serine/threonine-protein kinase RsbW
MRKLNSDFCISSHPENVDKIECIVNELASRFHISPDIQGNLLLSLTEAVTNAIRHGNRCDCSKKVSISLRAENGALAVRVSDEGPGFDPNTVPDPTADERLEKCGGRGLFIMRNFSDECEFMRGGSTVEMRFRLPGK